MTASSKASRFNLALNIFLVAGMLLAVTVTTIFKLQQPGVKTFMLLLAAFGSVMGVVNTVMSANGNILTFVFGFIDVLIGTIVYLDNGIMGNFALHAFISCRCSSSVSGNGARGERRCVPGRKARI